MQLDHEQMPETALAWHRAGRGAVLATVIETWGSAPRPVGGQLVISGDAELAGSVSGGCVEGAVVAEAIDALDDGKARVLEYGVSDDEAFAVGLACGGRIRVMVEPVGAAMPEDMLADLVDARAERRPVAYRVATDTWDRSLLSRDDDRVADRFRMDRSGGRGRRRHLRGRTQPAPAHGHRWSRAHRPTACGDGAPVRVRPDAG